MGQGYMLECGNGHFREYLLGVGMLYPSFYEDTVKEIQKGQYGDEWRRYFQNHPGAAVNASRDLYVCSKCHHPHEAINLDLYCRKGDVKSEDGWCYWCNDGDYEFVKSYDHRCPDCGSPMILCGADEDDDSNSAPEILCPECNAPMQFGFSGMIWD